MLSAAHAVLYAEDPDAARRFFADVLGLPNVDVHDGWLIFKLPPAELGVHPAAPPGGAAPSGHHELFFMCDDVHATVADLSAEGVEFTEPVTETRFGLLTRFRVPGAGEIGIYQPRHATAYDL
jgi:catechol 2,3-dioxygenase-like lactoylglutathione lyase family enzyme